MNTSLQDVFLHPDLGTHHLHVHQRHHLQQDWSPHLVHQLDQHQVFQHLQRHYLLHLEPHQLVHHDLEAERGNDIMDIMVIIFKFEMNIIEEKDICPYVPYVHQHPHLFQSPISAINFSIVDHIIHRISGKPKDHHLMVLIHQDQAPHHPLQHLCGHLHHSEEADPHFFQSSVGIINFCIVNQLLHHISGTPQHPHQAREDLLQHLEHLHHRGQHLQGPEDQQHQTSSTSRRENQQLENKIILGMVIKEEEVDIKTGNDREVIIIEIIMIIMQEHPGNSSHIMSDNSKSIYLKRCIIASEFVMDIDIYTLFIYLQDSFTKELIIQLKIILEKITQVDFDITLLIENCERIQHIYITYLIDLLNIIKKRGSKHLEKILYIFMEEHIRSVHLGAHINLKKVIIKFDVLDNLGHLAQSGHQSPTVIKLDILDCEWHLAITVEYHILDFSSISGPNYLSITSAINLDIIVNVERFIRVIHLFYICHLNMPDIIRAEQHAEHHLLDYISISESNYTSATNIKAEQIISDIFAEYHLLDYICINGPNYISATRFINLNIMVKTDRFIRTICPLHINLLINQDIVIKIEWFIKTITVEPCLPHHGNIIYISYAFMTSGFSIDIIVKKEKFIRIIFISYINLLYNADIDIKAERFIGTFHSAYIYLVKSINREAPSGDHELTLKSHRGASSMNIICVQDIMVKQEGLDIKTSCIFLNILCVFISKYFIFNESIIDNYFHIILLALHQCEALDITSLSIKKWSQQVSSHQVERHLHHHH